MKYIFSLFLCFVYKSHGIRCFFCGGYSSFLVRSWLENRVFFFFFLLFFGNLTSFVSEKILHNGLRYILGFVEWYYMILLQDI